jgi:hypothetical protein
MTAILFIVQRASAAVLAFAVTVHLATILYAVRGGLTDFVLRLMNRRERWMNNARKFNVIEADQGQVFRNSEPAFECSFNNTKGHDIVGCKDRGDIRVCVEQLSGKIRAPGEIEFPVAYDRLHRMLSGL